MLWTYSLRETVTNCFDVSLRRVPRGPDHVKHLQAYLTMFIPLVLYLIGLPAINALRLLLIALSHISLCIFAKATDMTCCAMRPDTLALTSTNGRACTPGIRAAGTTSALTSALGRACNPRR